MSDTLLKTRTVRLSDGHVRDLKKQARIERRDWTELIRMAVEDLLERKGRKNGK